MFARKSSIAALVAAVGLSALANRVQAEVEPISFSDGPAAFIETFEFANDVSSGDDHTTFSFVGAVAPAYPPDASHTLVVNFSWRLPDSTLVLSPDHIFTIPGAMTFPVSTGTFELADVPTTVGIQFAGGGPMTIVGSFTHITVPEPSSLALAVAALAGALIVGRRVRQR